MLDHLFSFHTFLSSSLVYKLFLFPFVFPLSLNIIMKYNIIFLLSVRGWKWNIFIYFCSVDSCLFCFILLFCFHTKRKYENNILNVWSNVWSNVWVLFKCSMQAYIMWAFIIIVSHVNCWNELKNVGKLYLYDVHHFYVCILLLRCRIYVSKIFLHSAMILWNGLTLLCMN